MVKRTRGGRQHRTDVYVDRQGADSHDDSLRERPQLSCSPLDSKNRCDIHVRIEPENSSMRPEEYGYVGEPLSARPSPSVLKGNDWWLLAEFLRPKVVSGFFMFLA